MIKDLEVDIDGSAKDRVRDQEQEFQKPGPKEKYGSLDNLAQNVESEIHQEG